MSLTKSQIKQNKSKKKKQREQRKCGRDHLKLLKRNAQQGVRPKKGRGSGASTVAYLKDRAEVEVEALKRDELEIKRQ